MQLDFKLVVEFFIYLTVCGFVWLPIWWLLDILTPKSILERYFKEPHFNGGELIALNLFPASLMRISIFGWGLCFPSLTKKRKLTGLAEDTPKWYALSLKIFTITVMIYGAIFFTILIGIAIYMFFFI